MAEENIENKLNKIGLITQEQFEADLETYIFNAIEYYNHYKKLANEYIGVHDDLVSMQVQYFKDKKIYCVDCTKDSEGTIDYKILDKKFVGFDYNGRK